jgi:hypothetical protein
MANPLRPCSSALWTGARFQIPVLESESYVTTDSQPASLSWNKAPIWDLRPDLCYLCDSYGLVLVGRPLWLEDGSVVCNCYWSSPAQSFLGPSPAGLVALPVLASTVLLITSLHGPSRKPRFRQYLYCCMRMICRRNVFTQPLPRHGSTRCNILRRRLVTTYSVTVRPSEKLGLHYDRRPFHSQIHLFAFGYRKSFHTSSSYLSFGLFAFGLITTYKSVSNAVYWD